MPVTFKVQERGPNTGLFSNQFQGTGASQVASVNPINMQFLDSQQAGGVNKMFLDRAGQAYKDEQKQLFENGNLNPGDAKVTGSGDLANQGVGKVLNVVYPDANDQARYGADPANNQQYKDDLKAAYTNMFNAAAANGITKIQMPLGGAGIFGGNIAKEDMAKLQGDAIKSAMADFQNNHPNASLDVNLTTDKKYTQLMQNQDLNNPQQQQVHVQPTQQPKKKQPQQPVIEFAPDIAPANQSLPKTFTFGQGLQATLSKTKEPGKFSLDFNNDKPVTENMSKLFEAMGINPPPEAKAGPNGELIYTLDASQSQKFNQALGIGQEKGQQKPSPQQSKSQDTPETTSVEGTLRNQENISKQLQQTREQLTEAKKLAEALKQQEKDTKKEVEGNIKKLEKDEKTFTKELEPLQKDELKSLEKLQKAESEMKRLESAKITLEGKEEKYHQKIGELKEAGGFLNGIKAKHYENKLQGVLKEKKDVLGGPAEDTEGKPTYTKLNEAQNNFVRSKIGYKDATEETQKGINKLSNTREEIGNEKERLTTAEQDTQKVMEKVKELEQQKEQLKEAQKKAEERVKEAQKQQEKDHEKERDKLKQSQKAVRKQGGVSFPSSSGMGGGNQGKGSSLVGLSGIKVEDTNKVQKDASPTKPKSSEQQIS